MAVEWTELLSASLPAFLPVAVIVSKTLAIPAGVSINENLHC